MALYLRKTCDWEQNLEADGYRRMTEEKKPEILIRDAGQLVKSLLWDVYNCNIPEIERKTEAFFESWKEKSDYDGEHRFHAMRFYRVRREVYWKLLKHAVKYENGIVLKWAVNQMEGTGMLEEGMRPDDDEVWRRLLQVKKNDQQPQQVQDEEEDLLLPPYDEFEDPEDVDMEDIDMEDIDMEEELEENLEEDPEEDSWSFLQNEFEEW